MNTGGLVLVTGANGFLGSACCRRLQADGYTVRAMVRDPDQAGALAPFAAGGLFRGALPDTIDPRAFAGVRTLVHCAFATRGASGATLLETNVHGSQQVLRLAREHGVAQALFISSLSARPEAESFYGRSKRQVEAMLDPDRDLALRPGLIIGRGGLFERMRRSVGTVPIVPLFYGGRQRLQTVWIDDVCSAVANGIARHLVGARGIGTPDGVDIRQFYRAIAALEGRRCRFVRLPGPPLLAGLRFAERLGLSLPVTSENLLGLKQMRCWPLEDDLAALDIDPLDFESSLARLRPGT